MSNDPSEIIVLYRFAAQETFLIIVIIDTEKPFYFIFQDCLTKKNFTIYLKCRSFNIVFTVVMWRSTEASKLVSKHKTSHIEALYRSLIRFAKSTWSMTSEASFTWKSRDCFSICFKRSEPQRRFLYITHYNALSLFSFYPNLYIKVKWTLPMK